MNPEKPANKDLYYTEDHEWIHFQGSVAYVGVCRFKLTGFKEIHQVKFNEPSDIMKKGDVIATIIYNDYEVEARMPVDGKIMSVNDALVSGDQGILLRHSEDSGWIALIVPSQLKERKDLLLPEQYKMGQGNL
jgi:glycine cleavage system H protein